MTMTNEASAQSQPASPARSDVMIRVAGLGKRFKLYTNPAHRLSEWLTGGRIKRHADFWAVRGVSFEVPRGECLGIMGPNGSGKSTLLKMLTRALHPTEGTLAVRGRVLSLIELGTGLNVLMTGRQNIFNMARLLDFPSGYARERVEEIREFADIGEFFDRPVRLYSSGMTVRLAFSMFACFRPEVFIVDEALSVGDVFFQQKCVRRLDEMLGAGMTMLFVSHDAQKVVRLSTRVALMDRGRVTFIGEPEEAAARYAAGLGGTRPAAKGRSGPAKAPGGTGSRAGFGSHNLVAPGRARHGTGAMSILGVTFEDERGRHALAVGMERAATIRALVRANQRIEQPSVGITLYDRLSNVVFAAGTRLIGPQLPAMEAGEELIVSFRLTFAVAPGLYTLGVGCSEASERGPDVGVIHDACEGLGPVRVTHDRAAGRPFFGIARLPLETSHERPGPAA